MSGLTLVGAFGIAKQERQRFDMAIRETEEQLTKRYGNVPHFSLIVRDGNIEIPSIFMFEGGRMEYYPFLRACEAYNCTVHLANENITIKPHDDDLIRHVKEAIYFQIAETPQIVEQYIKYLLNKESTSWDSMH